MASTYIKAIEAGLIRSAGERMAYWLRFWECHCWQCEQPRDYDREPKCPHCQADRTPF